VSPGDPVTGLMPVIVIAPVTTKSIVLVTVRLPVVTVILPDVAPAGILTFILVADASTTSATILLNFTVLPVSVALKLVPSIVIISPGPPVSGDMLVIVGGWLSFSLQAKK